MSWNATHSQRLGLPMGFEMKWYGGVILANQMFSTDISFLYLFATSVSFWISIYLWPSGTKLATRAIAVKMMDKLIKQET